MSDIESRLFRLGLTNRDSEGLSGLAVDKRISRAYCTSKKCSRNHIGAVKKVDQGKSMCPDCGEALVWRFVKLYN